MKLDILIRKVCVVSAIKIPLGYKSLKTPPIQKFSFIFQFEFKPTNISESESFAQHKNASFVANQASSINLFSFLVPPHLLIYYNCAINIIKAWEFLFKYGT